MKSFSLHACVAWLKREPLKNIARIFLALSIVCFPFQVRTLLFSPDVFVSGNFNPFTAVFLSLNNLLVVVSGVFYGVWILRKRLFLRRNSQDFFWWWGLFFASIAFASLFALNPQVHWSLAFHWVIIFLWFLLLSSDLLPWKFKFQCFVGAMFFESILAISQYALQSSIGLTKLGEPVLNSHVLGIAKMDLQGVKFIRPYGTFPHTNVLAGAVVFAFFACLHLLQKSLKRTVIASVFFGVTLILTFSRSAWLAFLIALVLSLVATKVKHKLVIFGSIVLVVAGVLLTQIQAPLVNRVFGSDGQSSVERQLYMDISQKMFLNNPMGVGLGNFTLEMTNFTDQKLAPWVIQPVHNVYLLIANELGIFGLLLVLLLIGNLVYLVAKEVANAKNSPLHFTSTSLKIALISVFLIISLFDHYFFTLEQGQFLFIFLVSYLCYVEKNEALPRMKS
jgi:O-antigen ligase